MKFGTYIDSGKNVFAKDYFDQSNKPFQNSIHKR